MTTAQTSSSAETAGRQPELDFAPEVSGREVEEFVSFLNERRERWVTAAHYLAVGPMRGHASEDNKRFIRALAQGNNGRICGGVKGYRLTVALTDAEYAAWRSAWLHSASEIQERVARADAVRLNEKYKMQNEKLPEPETAAV